MSTPSIQTLITQAQQVLNLKSSNEIRATLAAVLANANVGTPLNPNLTTQQLWDEFYEIVRQPSDDIMSIITDQMMRMVFSPPAPGGAGADKQVIFNDGGVLAGDAGLMYNKATDALTITGDLTVRTNKLLVTATGVGVGAAPVNSFDVTSTSGTLSVFKRTGSNGAFIGIEDGSGAGLAYLGFTNGTFSIQTPGSGYSDKLSVDTSGNVLMGVASANANGGVLQLKSGITFPATQVAASDANTLDDYEEGTWVPTQGTGLTVVGAFSSSGTYTKVGRLVTITGVVNAVTSVTAGAGGIICGALPFSAAQQVTATAINSTFNAGSFCAVNVTDFYAVTAMAGTTSIRFSATYIV